MRIALYQPEIAGNVGAVLRLAACFEVAVDIIEPCGFVFSDARLRRAGMDYAERVTITRHVDWLAFRNALPARLLLMTTHGIVSLFETVFEENDTLLFGSESSGVPGSVAEDCYTRLRIPIARETRSLNLAVAAGIGLSEALRQTKLLPA